MPIDNQRRVNTVDTKIMSKRILSYEIADMLTFGCLNCLPDDETGDRAEEAERLLEEAKAALKDPDTLAGFQELLQRLSHEDNQTIDKAIMLAVEAGRILAKREAPAKINQDEAAKDVREELRAVIGAHDGKTMTLSTRQWLPLLPKSVAKHRLNDVWLGRIFGRVSELDPFINRTIVKQKVAWHVRKPQPA